MDAAALRAMQAPIKERYKSAPEAALVTLKAKGALDATNIACKVETGRALAVAGLHPATGGSTSSSGFGKNASISIGRQRGDVVTILNVCPSMHASDIDASAMPTTGWRVTSRAALIAG